MRNDKMREEFEAWVESEDMDAKCETGFLMWEAWQASRESVVVNLAALSAKARHVENGVGTGLIRYDEACAAIEAAGARIQP